jgi:hypothetical protein
MSISPSIQAFTDSMFGITMSLAKLDIAIVVLLKYVIPLNSPSLKHVISLFGLVWFDFVMDFFRFGY